MVVLWGYSVVKELKQLMGIVMTEVPGGLKGPQKASFSAKNFFVAIPAAIFL